MDASETLGVPAATMLTVEEAAAVLRIGRSLAYQLAREYDATGGVSGLPVIRLGGCLPRLTEFVGSFGDPGGCCSW